MDGAPARRDYLAELLQVQPAFLALVRAIECGLLAEAGPLEPRALDVGCGDGWLAATAFAEPLFAGLDRRGNRAREARQRGAHRWLLAADATALPFRDGSFGSVLANSVLQVVPDVEQAVAEAARVLRPGGRFLFTVPSERFADFLLGSAAFRALGWPRLARGYGAWFNHHSGHCTVEGQAAWAARVERHGLRVERCRPYLSAAGHRAFDLGHYLGLPRLVSKQLTGRWLAFPNPVANALFAAWLRPYVREAEPAAGAYLFFICRKPAR